MRVARALGLAPILVLTAIAFAPQSSLAVKARKVTFHINRLPISDALNEFGRQTGLAVVIQSEVGRGVISPKLDGDFTPADALDKLLLHTGLHYEYLDTNTIAVLGPSVYTKTTIKRVSTD